MTDSGVVKKRRGVIKDFRSSFPPPSPGSPRALPTQPAPCPNTMTKLSYRAFPAAPGSSGASRWVRGPSRPSLLWCVSLGGVRVPLLCQPPPQPGAMPRSDHPTPLCRPLPGHAAPCPQIMRGCYASPQAASPSTFTWTTTNVSPGRLLKGSRPFFSTCCF